MARRKHCPNCDNVLDAHSALEPRLENAGLDDVDVDPERDEEPTHDDDEASEESRELDWLRDARQPPDCRMSSDHDPEVDFCSKCGKTSAVGVTGDPDELEPQLEARCLVTGGMFHVSTADWSRDCPECGLHLDVRDCQVHHEPVPMVECPKTGNTRGIKEAARGEIYCTCPECKARVVVENGVAMHAYVVECPVDGASDTYGPEEGTKVCTHCGEEIVIEREAALHDCLVVCPARHRRTFVPPQDATCLCPLCSREVVVENGDAIHAFRVECPVKKDEVWVGPDDGDYRCKLCRRWITVKRGRAEHARAKPSAKRATLPLESEPEKYPPRLRKHSRMKYARTRVDTDGIHNIYESTWPRDASKKRKIIAIVNDSCIGGLTAVAQAKGGKCKRVFRLSSEDLRPRVEFRTVREACRIAAILAVMVRNRIRAADRKLGACRA